MKFLPRTRLPILCFEQVDARGVRRHVVVLRASFDVGPRGTLVPKWPQPPLNFAERAFGETLSSAPRDESHLAPEKPAVDLIVHANAYAPEDRASPRFGAALAVTEAPSADGRAGSTLLTRRLAVTGPREWCRGRMLGDWVLSDPVPVTEVPLRFDLAYGGTVRVDDPAHGLPRSVRVAHPDNPVGRGFFPTVDAVAAAYGLTTGTARELVQAWEERTPRLAAPQVEDPTRPLRALSDRPPLAGWGLVGKHWGPRYQHAGTYDEAWVKARYPVLPEDFDARYWNAAHPELQLPWLPEDAVLAFHGVVPGARSPDQTLTVQLPALRPIVSWRDLDLDGPQRGTLRMDTVLLDLLDDSLTLLYRFSIPDAPSLAWIEVEGP